MNRHLKDAERAKSTTPITAPPGRSAQQTAARQRPWINWLLVVGVVFGAYIYLGRHVLKEEYTWAYISGTVAGQTAAAATKAATEAEAAKAAAVAASTVAAETAPKASQAAAVITAETEPKLKQHAGINDLDVDKAAREAAIRADAEARAAEATNLAKCENAKREVAQAAMNAAAERKTSLSGLGGPTLSAITGVAEMATIQMEALCEQFKSARDTARKDAEEAARPKN